MVSTNATEPTSSENKAVDLFGGALAVTLPGTMRDMSDFIPVPDNQETFQDMSTNFGQLIFEILDRTEGKGSDD